MIKEIESILNKYPEIKEQGYDAPWEVRDEIWDAFKNHLAKLKGKKMFLYGICSDDGVIYVYTIMGTKQVLDIFTRYYSRYFCDEGTHMSIFVEYQKDRPIYVTRDLNAAALISFEPITARYPVKEYPANTQDFDPFYYR